MLNVGVGLAAGRIKSICPGKLSSRRDAEHQASAQRFKGKPCIPGRWLAKPTKDVSSLDKPKQYLGSTLKTTPDIGKLLSVRSWVVKNSAGQFS